jgi:hypothetical protein
MVLVSVTLAGPPNAGKSTLFNRLVRSDADRTNSNRLRSRNKISGRLVRYAGSAEPGGDDDDGRRRGKKHWARRRSPPRARGMTGGGAALVSAVAGTTRDANVLRGRLAGIDFEVVDTAGIDRSFDVASRGTAVARTRGGISRPQSAATTGPDGWVDDALLQTRSAMEASDVVFLVVDGRLRSLTSDVHETASQLRSLLPPPAAAAAAAAGGGRGRKTWPVVRVLVNKMESFVAYSHSSSSSFDDSGSNRSGGGGNGYPEVLREAERLGFGEPIPISALHGEGMAEIAAVIQEAANDRLAERAEAEEHQELLSKENNDDDDDEEGDDPAEPPPLKLAICGRYVGPVRRRTENTASNLGRRCPPVALSAFKNAHSPTYSP